MDTEEAIEKGIEFLERKAGFSIHQLQSVNLERDIWVLRFDVGAFVEKLVELRIDDTTGRIINYERPTNI